MRTLAALAFVLALAGEAQAADLSVRAAAEALAADRAFAARAQVVSPAQAFREYMEGAEGLLYGSGGEPARGGAAIYAMMGGDAAPTLRVEWTPTRAWAAASGDMAVTIGDWKRTWLNGARPPMTGNYVTVWRKSAAGWKGLIDIGEVDEAPKPAAPSAP